MSRGCELLCAWRAGDRAARNALIGAHFASVCRFFRTKLGDDVEDLLQQTFLDLLAASSPVTSVRATLFTIARRRLLDHLRARYQRDEIVLVTSLSVADLRTSPSMAAARGEQQRVLHEALCHIPLGYRMTLEMAYGEDLSGPEIAEILEIPEHTVRSRLSRARQALRDQVEALDRTPRATRPQSSSHTCKESGSVRAVARLIEHDSVRARFAAAHAARAAVCAADAERTETRLARPVSPRLKRPEEDRP